MQGSSTQILPSSSVRKISLNRDVKRNSEPFSFKEKFIGEITKPETIKEVCRNVDIVISTVGITKQKDGLTYENVDYLANLNLLNVEAVSQYKISAKRSSDRGLWHIAAHRANFSAAFSTSAICKAQLILRRLRSSGVVERSKWWSGMPQILFLL